MRTIRLGNPGLAVPAIAVGCMRLNKLDKTGAARFLNAAIELGANSPYKL